MVSTRQALRFRIELQGLSPAIWREIDVPSSYSFWDLHVALQDAMGWLDCHLHAFRPQEPRADEMLEIGIPIDDFIDGDMEYIPGWEIPVLSIMSEPGQTLCYEYDFGDSWNHVVLLKEIVPRERGGKYPRCTVRERACPPEDCGGIWGYQELLEAVKIPTHEQHEEMIEWVGEDFDSEKFDPGLVTFDNPKKRWKIAFEE